MIRIVNRPIKIASSKEKGETKGKAIYLAMLFCFVFFSTARSQTIEIRQARTEYNNGNYAKALEFAEIGIAKAEKIRNNSLMIEVSDIAASSQIWLGKYPEAENTLIAALQKLPTNLSAASWLKAMIYIRFAWLRRQQRKPAEALEYSKKAVAAAPGNQRIEAEHFYNIGRIMFKSGYDISAIVWLEKAEKLIEADDDNPTKPDVYRFLSLAWSSRLNYQMALKYAEKGIASAEKTAFKAKHRQALFELSTVLSASGQKRKAFDVMEKGLKLSVEQNGRYHACLFLSSLLLNTLEDGEVNRAADYLVRLEKIDADKEFDYEIKLGKAVISAFRRQSAISENLFAELNRMQKTSAFAEPYWKITIAERNKDWEQIIRQSQRLLELAAKENYLEDLPVIYLNFAKAYFSLGQIQQSAENLKKSLALIEEARQSDNPNLSLGLLETYHKGYRLLVQLRSENIWDSFELSDFLKARLLKDRINGMAAKTAVTVISPALRTQLEELSIKFIDDPSLAAEIEKTEKLTVNSATELNLQKPNLTELNDIAELKEAAIISYFFTLDKKLLAYVWENNKPIRVIHLPVTENEIDDDAKATQEKIRNLIFFKRDGQRLFDKLIRPLSISTKHLIIVPDKSLWNIPFRALSADGEKYLIEEKMVSYAPSISILLEQLKKEKPARQTMLVFANSSFKNRLLRFVDAEAASVAQIYEVKPILDAAVADFTRSSDKADIVHFSMHAVVDNEQPLNSFLGFRKTAVGDGRLTVEEILNNRLKKGSLIFLASCDTNNVLNGEGLVSLAWAMTAAGATTVVSAQWEADDKSTMDFTKAFYENYKQGDSSAEALQKAAQLLIGNKSNNMHEPYYWANFTLTGDFR